ncbi:hypothetical protein [Roseovarius sp.]|uniref:hypothetical protein n=1 Tax=Roseovarius sp. TaxID=1486281 RepID=UPI000C61FDF5|nr:hypothetical protein [Roseovarius sp.]MAZ22661.1 hypothetical protein [Roseovarius sp.]
MSRSDPYVVVHGGVHKTATSHVQSLLQRNAGKLRKLDVNYIHHRDTRKDYTNPCQLNGYLKLDLDFKPNITDDDLAVIVRDFWDKVDAQPGQRVILSDENVPGHCGHCVRRGLLYWRRSTLLPIFADNIRYPVREVHIALRNYADFFASAFVEFLRSAQGERVFPEVQMRRNVLSELPSWVDFMQDVQSAFRGARIIVWRHEDFNRLLPSILEGLCGGALRHEDMAQPKRSRSRPSASHRAVQEILMEIERFGGNHALARRVEIQDKYPRGPDYPGYDPWAPSERAHLTRLYERDIDTIRKTMDVTFLDPS